MSGRLLQRKHPQQPEQFVGRILVEHEAELAEDRLEQSRGVQSLAIDNRDCDFSGNQVGKLANQGGLAGQRRTLDQAQSIGLGAGLFENRKPFFIRTVRDGRQRPPVGPKRLFS